MLGKKLNLANQIWMPLREQLWRQLGEKPEKYIWNHLGGKLERQLVTKFWYQLWGRLARRTKECWVEN